MITSQHVSKIRPQRSLAKNFDLRFANLLTLSSVYILALNAHNNELRVCLIKVTHSVIEQTRQRHRYIEKYSRSHTYI